MKFIPTTLLVTLLATASVAQAGIVVGGTRLIYDGGKKESSLSVNNPDKTPYLIQSWIETTTGGAEKAPFMVTPPLFRLDGGQENVLRVVRAGGNLPNDKESLYWMNIKSIPSVTKDTNQNTLQIAVKTRIKLIYRPEGLKGVPEEQTEKLTWQRKGNSVQVTNPTPFYMNFQLVKVGGKELKEATYVAPMDTATFALPAGSSGGSVSWKIISDYGGIGNEHTKPL
ncbi:fimbrial biogenesis chaperone [Serratia fonticola]|jgi:P pilus assembly chaperone PapD|uniref:Chaperone protein fimC n=1 Tax=Serratia fonticola TaxID=47917 RepID=A0A0F7HB81_SERFO|nr:molecular chaperone [Serratia fonticola]AKG70091.1 long polar fimbrial chaperone LpfB [Serratia fonticola]CAI0803214.1 Chaperone protein fimC precursor [Serratia fonticola]CAI0805512.1 Chaperone protein fimC precursor [Serratia fonticola]CAI1633732.1 Chaperone protein fimC precursor [Serratia fonticola]CAI1711542.1 Chaperone protein fimC precursor [Serratia fonticola]